MPDKVPAAKSESKADKVLARMLVRPGSNFSFKRRDPDESFGWDKEDAKKELARLVAEIDVLQLKLVAEGRQSLLIVLQAIDAAGKDGTVRNVFGPLNAAGVHVSSFKAPVGEELEHDFLWRVHAQAPRRGEIGVWNRSHYEDVLIVRVKNIVPRERWERRYRHIREFERLLVDEGTHLVKINLHISKDEQRERLQARLDDPAKRWKLDPADFEQRKKWPAFQRAYQDAMQATDADHAPWYVVPADSKPHRNLAIASLLLETLEGLKLDWPKPDPALLDMKFK